MTVAGLDDITLQHEVVAGRGIADRADPASNHMQVLAGRHKHSGTPETVPVSSRCARRHWHLTGKAILSNTI
jgi:hypothetical protein